jgi:hypothetical protein
LRIKDEMKQARRFGAPASFGGGGGNGNGNGNGTNCNNNGSTLTTCGGSCQCLLS